MIEKQAKKFNKSEHNTYLQNKYGITKRTANSIISDVQGTYNALKELKEYELKQIGQKIRHLEDTVLPKLIRQRNNNSLILDVHPNKEDVVIKQQNLRKKIVAKKNKLNKLYQQKANLEYQLDTGRFKICFGTKKLLKQNYAVFVKRRDSQMSFVGSKDETAGNQTLQLSYNKQNNQFTVKLRKDFGGFKQANKSQKYAYGKCYYNHHKDKIIETLAKCNASLSYKIIKKNDRFYLHCTFEYVCDDTLINTRVENGTIGLDFNKGFITAAETNYYGHMVHTMFYPYLLLGKYEYRGNISTSVNFDYFPYQLSEEQVKQPAIQFCEEIKHDCEQWRIFCELNKLNLDGEVLYRPFETLSHGERTKVMLAILFSGENDFLLIDEPTNHLDRESREQVKEYLNSKKSFILVSHDRDLLDDCIDHVLVLKCCSIEVQSGNFSSWWENKEKKDAFSQTENEKHKKEIRKLNQAAERTRDWANKSEASKIGFNPVKEHDRSTGARAFIGAKTKKMQSRVKQMEQRIEREIEAKEGLLQDIESIVDLKIMPLKHHKEVLVRTEEYGISYGEKTVFKNLKFELRQGERVFLHGENGCGKSSLIKAILRSAWGKENMSGAKETGTLYTASGLKISYINQDTSFLKGSLKDFCGSRELDPSLLLAILRQLDFERVQFKKNMEDYSEGQKKKVLIAASLLAQAHLYIWDEPLNYIDVFSRMQIEKLLLKYQPTMLLVDHDVRFKEKIATRIVKMQ